jgi:hypothetical protein
MVNAGVVASEGADADHRDLKQIVSQDSSLRQLPETFD